MKKLILIIAFIFICLQGKSQQIYDTIIYYPPSVLNCPMWMDSVELNNPSDPSSKYSVFYHYGKMRRTCDLSLPLINTYDPVIGPQDTNYVNTRAFAQPYHLDSAVLVIGVAAKVGGTKPGMSPVYNYFRLMDSTKTEIATVAVPFLGSTPGPIPSLWNIIQGKYYFNNQVTLKDFYIAVDMPTGQEYTQGGSMYWFDHTISFTDEVCLKIDRGCYEGEYPYFLRRNATQWTRFDNDSLYKYYRKKHIGWFPIILVPRPDSSNLVNDIDIDNTCNVFPNPAKDRLKVISQFKVKDIEIYNISGIKVKTIAINSYEKFVDISDLIAGTYIVKLYTPRGIATKKILVE
jgi:hypothetical protein